MPPQYVSLIHGVRRLHRVHPNTGWMDELRAFLLERDVAAVTCFRWSGAILRGMRAIDASRYADALLRDYRRAQDAGGSLSIISKSAGGIIAEKALALLNDEIQIDLFLRIGVPDVRKEVSLRNVHRIANITSLRDRLFALGRLVVPYFVRPGESAEAIATTNIQLRTLSHYALSELTPLKNEGVPDETTYDLYWRLLRAQDTQSASGQTRSVG